MAGSIKGLTSFISRIKNCNTQLEEDQKIEQEMAKIRRKFANKGLSGSRKKKYIWKLLYINMLGYGIELGNQEAITLINSGIFTEKIAGYIATSILFNETNSEMLDIVILSIKSDLISHIANMPEAYTIPALLGVGALGAGKTSRIQERIYNM